VLVLGENYLGFKADMVVDWQRNRYTYPLKAMEFYRKEISHYDVFHFNFGRTLFDYRSGLIDMLELPWLKRKGKRIVFTYQGSDARLAGYSLQHYDVSFYTELPQAERDKELEADARRLRRISKADKYADLIYTTNPDLKNILPARTKFRPYTKLQLAEWLPAFSDYEKDGLVIAHAPTNRSKKGTDVILAAVESLRQSGVRVELDLIENVPNQQVRERLARADIVIDQIYVGWYGGLAVESMALGKPVISYIREEDMVHIPAKMNAEMPVIRANPQNIADVLTRITTDRQGLREIARRSRAYVEHWHDSQVIAQGIIEDYNKIL
jgi:glycosyltransferase involved in cell wall biosynthesis